MPSPTLAADPTLAVAAYLSTELHAVSGNVSEGLKVWHERVPEVEERYMPNACVVITPAGGGHMFGRTTYGLMDVILDLTCFADTRLHSENVAREAMAAMYELRQATYEGVTLRWARIAHAPVSEIDKESNWPYSLLSCQVAHNLYSR